VLHVPFRVAQMWLPQPKGKPGPNLPAEIPLRLTATDVQRGINPVARWLATRP